MKNLDFESWDKEHKDINNNLAVPSYRAFCKAYDIKFNFGDEENDIDHDKHMAIHLDEMPLHGKALSLFNFVNKPYHPFRESLVSFAYTSWDDFDYENLTLEEVAEEMKNKDIDIKKLKYESATYSTIAVFSTSVLLALVVNLIIKINILSIVVFVASLVLLPMTVLSVYKRREKAEQEKFDSKLLELQRKLKDVHLKHEQAVIVKKQAQSVETTTIKPDRFPNAGEVRQPDNRGRNPKIDERSLHDETAGVSESGTGFIRD